MSGSKYPAFERKCANHLAVGSRILVRDRISDALLRHDAKPRGSVFDRADCVPPGIYTVVGVTSTLKSAGRRSTRYYHVTLAAERDPIGERYTTAGLAAPTRYNLITEAS